MSESNCRSCQINLELVLKKGKHVIKNLNMFCPLCKKLVDCLCHEDNIGLLGASLECLNCNDYIIYTYKKNIWKDEIYFTNNLFLIRDIDDKTSSFYDNNKLLLDLNYLVDLTSTKDIKLKLKRLLHFA